MYNRKYRGEFAFGAKRKNGVGKRVHHSARLSPKERKYVEEDAIPLIISKETYDCALELYKSRKHKKIQKRYYPLSGVIKCEHCNSNMYGYSTNGQEKGVKVKRYRYRCEKCSDNRTIRADLLERHVIERFVNLIFNETNEPELVKAYKPYIDSKKSALRFEKTNLTKLVNKTQKELDKSIKALKNKPALTDDESFMRDKLEIESKLLEYKSLYNSLSGKTIDVKENFKAEISSKKQRFINALLDGSSTTARALFYNRVRVITGINNIKIEIKTS